jgi:hypothetical protein
VSVLLNKLKQLERELNETHNLKRTYPEFPIDVKIPPYRVFRDSLCLFYQKRYGFKAWSPNHFTRASLVGAFVPCAVRSTVTETNLTPSLRAGLNDMSYWDVQVGDGANATTKVDTILKGSTIFAANSGTSAVVDGPTAYQRQFSAVFNASVFPSGYTIREVGWFSKAVISTSISGQSFTQGTVYLMSRFSVGDGDFAAYSPNIALPLTVNLVYQWTLA